MNVIGELAAFVAGAKASGLPAADRERLRLHFLDTVVAARVGALIPEGEALQGLGDDGALAIRIGRQAAAIRLTEIDDIHLPSCTTPSAGVVPVALMLAAREQKFDPGEVASAVMVGTEIMTRIGVAVRGPQILYRGIWPTYLAAPIAAAATSARLMGLSEARTGHALSLAVMLMAGGVGRIHGAPSGRWFLYANAVAAGVAAAEAARADYRGDPDILDKTWLTDSHGIALDRERLTEKLGVSTVYAALSLKPFCSAKQGIAAIEAFRTILDRGVRAETISKVRVRVPPAYAGMIATRAEAGADNRPWSASPIRSRSPRWLRIVSTMSIAARRRRIPTSRGSPARWRSPPTCGSTPTIRSIGPRKWTWRPTAKSTSSVSSRPSAIPSIRSTKPASSPRRTACSIRWSATMEPPDGCKWPAQRSMTPRRAASLPRHSLQVFRGVIRA